MTDSASHLVIRAMEWASLNDIGDVEPLNISDNDCLQELYEVLCRHGKSTRFGITLIHKHFDMSDDEVLIEQTDESRRTLTLSPEKLNSERIANSIETSWMFSQENGEKIMTVCYRRCDKGVFGEHKRNHY
ncbi:MAG: hypothetical protein GVY09_13255 [Gammaproteobacteria bacterium]|jgi:hypothetical protein|nr:hypothetical protein [Gammaproteobacteria bacterium]